MDETKRPLLALVAMIVLISSLISIYLTQQPRFAGINLLPFEGVGDVLAEQTMQRMPQGGKVLLVTQQMKLPALQAPVRRFLEAIEERPDLVVVGTEELEMELDESFAPGIMGINGEKFLGLIAKYPAVDLVISFIGAPSLVDDEWAQLRSEGRQLYLVSSFEPDIKDLVGSGRVDLAIVPRYAPMEGVTEDPKTRRQWFDRLYTITTPETAHELP